MNAKCYFEGVIQWGGGGGGGRREKGEEITDEPEGRGKINYTQT